MCDYKSFETDRLLLRPVSVKDAAFILELLNTTKWLKYIGDRDVRSLDDAIEYIETKMIPQLKRLGYSNYTLIRKSDGAKIGTCGLYDREGLEGIDIGFALLPEYERNGYGLESARKLKNVAFDEFGITEIKAITSKENSSSKRLLEKLGLKFIGNVGLAIHDDDENLLLYEIKSIQR